MFIAAVLLVLVAISASSLFFYIENADQYFYTFLLSNQVRYFGMNSIRYLFVALVPLSWLAFEFTKKEEQKDSVIPQK